MLCCSSRGVSKGQQTGSLSMSPSPLITTSAFPVSHQWRCQCGFQSWNTKDLGAIPTEMVATCVQCWDICNKKKLSMKFCCSGILGCSTEPGMTCKHYPATSPKNYCATRIPSSNATIVENKSSYNSLDFMFINSYSHVFLLRFRCINSKMSSSHGGSIIAMTIVKT